MFHKQRAASGLGCISNAGDQPISVAQYVEYQAAAHLIRTWIHGANLPQAGPFLPFNDLPPSVQPWLGILVMTDRLVYRGSGNHVHEILPLPPPPTKGLVYPKSDEKYPFMTYEEIMPVVSRTTDEEEISKLWESLFLMKVEIGDVLDDVY
jgi:hypothetical protein